MDSIEHAKMAMYNRKRARKSTFHVGPTLMWTPVMIKVPIFLWPPLAFPTIGLIGPHQSTILYTVEIPL